MKSPTVEVTRYELPAIGALNFMLKNALRGGVTRSLALHAHKKAPQLGNPGPRCFGLTNDFNVMTFGRGRAFTIARRYGQCLD